MRRNSRPPYTARYFVRHRLPAMSAACMMLRPHSPRPCRGAGTVLVARRRQRNAQGQEELGQIGGVEARAASGGWYRKAGSGMGPTPSTAPGMHAYIVTDPALG